MVIDPACSLPSSRKIRDQMSQFSLFTTKGEKVCIPNQVQVICLWSLSCIFTETPLCGDGWAGVCRLHVPAFLARWLPLTSPEEAQQGVRRGHPGEWLCSLQSPRARAAASPWRPVFLSYPQGRPWRWVCSGALRMRDPLTVLPAPGLSSFLQPGVCDNLRVRPLVFWHLCIQCSWWMLLV